MVTLSSVSSGVFSSLGNAVFFNLFSEAEPFTLFTATLIAHSTHVFWGDS